MFSEFLLDFIEISFIFFICISLCAATMYKLVVAKTWHLRYIMGLIEIKGVEFAIESLVALYTNRHIDIWEAYYLLLQFYIRDHINFNAMMWYMFVMKQYR